MELGVLKKSVYFWLINTKLNVGVLSGSGYPTQYILLAAVNNTTACLLPLP